MIDAEAAVPDMKWIGETPPGPRQIYQEVGSQEPEVIWFPGLPLSFFNSYFSTTETAL